MPFFLKCRVVRKEGARKFMFLRTPLPRLFFPGVDRGRYLVVVKFLPSTFGRHLIRHLSRFIHLTHFHRQSGTQCPGTSERSIKGWCRCITVTHYVQSERDLILPWQVRSYENPFVWGSDNASFARYFKYCKLHTFVFILHGWQLCH